MVAAAIQRNDEDSGEDGAESLPRASVLRPLVRAYPNRAGGLESGISDAVWELGASRTSTWRWIRSLAEEGGRTSAMVPRKHGRPMGSFIGCCHFNSPSLKVGMAFFDQAACVADLHASNYSSRW